MGRKKKAPGREASTAAGEPRRGDPEPSLSRDPSTPFLKTLFDLAGRTTISPCRCGHSKNKPFCDGNHNMAAFKSDEKARALPPPKPKV